MATTRRGRADDSEPAKVVPPHTTPPPAEPTTKADSELGEYEIGGSTYLLTAKDAEARGAKAVNKPANKAVTPQNK